MSENFDVPKALSGTGGWLDDRFHGARGFRVLMRKVFPDHWSFMLGEIALWSFVVLLLTGTFLSFFFVPSMTDVVYHGSYVKLNGLADERGVPVDAEHQLRRARRAADAADPPLGRRPVHGLAHDPHAAGVLHRRLPQAA